MIGLDTSDLEARLERRIADRVVAEISALLNGNGNGRDRLLSLKQVAERIGKSKRTVADWVKAGQFPSRTAVIGSRQMWSERVVEEWVREKGQG